MTSAGSAATTDRWVRGAAVLAGGVVGTLARWAAVAVVPESAVLAIVVVNLVGAWLLGLLAPRVAHPVVRAFALTGVLGALTTFSTWVVDVLLLVERGIHVGWVVLHVVGTLVGGLFLARVGLSRSTVSSGGLATATLEVSGDTPRCDGEGRS